MVASHARARPPLHGTKVIPSGRLAEPITIPEGSFDTGVPADTIFLEIYDVVYDNMPRHPASRPFTNHCVGAPYIHRVTTLTVMRLIQTEPQSQGNGYSDSLLIQSQVTCGNRQG